MSHPYLWIQDNGGFGCIVVIAFTEDNAREIMKIRTEGYRPSIPVESYPIDLGFCFESIVNFN